MIVIYGCFVVKLLSIDKRPTRVVPMPSIVRVSYWLQLTLLVLNSDEKVWSLRGMILSALLIGAVVTWDDVVVVPLDHFDQSNLCGKIWSLSHPVINNNSCCVAQPCWCCLPWCDIKILWPMHLLQWWSKTDPFHHRRYGASLQW